MRYIKTYEDTKLKMKPGYMYDDLGSIFCFIGYNNQHINYPNLVLVFHKHSEPDFMEWVPLKHIKPLNMTIKDYMIKNDIVIETMEAFRLKEFSGGGPTGNSIDMIEKIEKRLLKDDDISTIVAVNKYNL